MLKLINEETTENPTALMSNCQKGCCVTSIITCFLFLLKSYEFKQWILILNTFFQEQTNIYISSSYLWVLVWVRVEYTSKYMAEYSWHSKFHEDVSFFLLQENIAWWYCGNYKYLYFCDLIKKCMPSHTRQAWT